MAALAGPVEPAHACSCGAPDPARDLPVVDAAFVGRVVGRHVERPTAPVLSSTDPAYWTFEVEQAVKGTLPRQLVVRSAVDSASCGLGLAQGEQVGLLLDRDGEDYTSSLCRQVDPALLARHVQPGASVAAVAELHSPTWWRYAVAGALGLAAAAGAALLIRRRAARGGG